MSDRDKIIQLCQRVLINLEAFKTASMQYGPEFLYGSLPQCVISVVFSINARYPTELNTVNSYCSYVGYENKGWERHRCSEELLPISRQESISHMLSVLEESLSYHSSEKFGFSAENIFKNKQRTSSQNGILKAEAVYLFASALKKLNIEYYQDLQLNLVSDIERTIFQNSIKLIPGHRSGISINYFYMLSGDEWHIKPDRHIINFIKVAGVQDINDNPIEIEKMIIDACHELRKEYPYLTPRSLDYTIWKYMSGN